MKLDSQRKCFSGYKSNSDFHLWHRTFIVHYFIHSSWSYCI